MNEICRIHAFPRGAALAALLLTLGGCSQPRPGILHRYALSEVPILGGTAEQHAAVRAELANFERWSGPGRVMLSGIVFRPLEKEEWAGLYTLQEDRISLKENIGVSDIRPMLRHELCHALNDQERLLQDSHEVMDGVADRARQLPSHREWDELSDRRARSEVMADLCEVGPVGADLLLDACPGDPAEEQLLLGLQWLLEVVWTGEPDWVPRGPPLDTPSAPSWPLPELPEFARMFGTSEPRTVLIEALGEDWGVGSGVDVYTGEEVPIPAGPLDLTLTLEELPLPVPDELKVARTNGLPQASSIVYEGQAAAIVTTEGLRYWGPADARLLLDSGDGWQIVDGACANPETGSVFVADDSIFLGWTEGPAMHWSRLIEP